MGKGRTKEKTEAVNVRLTKRDKFALELGARAAGLSQAAFVTTALMEKLTLRDLNMYHPMEAHRVANIAREMPDLLEPWEEVVWTLVNSDKKYWQEDASPNMKTIREDWTDLKKKAHELMGEATQ